MSDSKCTEVSKVQVKTKFYIHYIYIFSYYGLNNYRILIHILYIFSDNGNQFFLKQIVDKINYTLTLMYLLSSVIAISVILPVSCQIFVLSLCSLYSRNTLCCICVFRCADDCGSE